MVERIYLSPGSVGQVSRRRQRQALGEEELWLDGLSAFDDGGDDGGAFRLPGRAMGMVLSAAESRIGGVRGRD